MTARPHDALFKAAFEHPEHAGALLRGILSPALRDAIEWDTLTHEPGSFIDRQLDDGHTDLLFSAKLTTAQPDIDSVYLYLLFEHRSTPEPQLPRRLLRYLEGIWERHDEQHGGPLPLVLPLLRDARDASTLQRNLEFWRESFREALRAPNGMQMVAQLLRYIYLVSANLHFQQFREKIREQLHETEETAMTIAEELIQQGRMEGRMEGRADALVRMLVQRYGSVPERFRERVAAATDEQFDRYCRRMFEVSTLEALFDD